MTERQHYTVTAERDGPRWLLRVIGMPGAFSQVRRLDQAEAMARDLIAVFLDVPADSFDVGVVPTVEGLGAIGEVVEEAKRERAIAEQHAGVAQELTRLCVVLLEKEGLPNRDIGDLVGISHQRVAQLLGDRTRRAATLTLWTRLQERRPGDSDWIQAGIEQARAKREPTPTA